MPRLAPLRVPSDALSLVLIGALVAAMSGVGAILRPPHGHELDPQLPRDVAVMSKVQANAMLRNRGACFVPNLGQWEHQAAYVTCIGPMTAFLEANGWTFKLVKGTRGKQEQQEQKESASVAVRMRFEGAETAELVPQERLPGVHHYFLGNDPNRWRCDVPLYSGVRYREIHPGLDVCAREQNGHFEFDLVLDADADLGQAEVTVEGIERMHLDRDGTLVLETALGHARLPPPLTWEEGPGGETSPLECSYVMLGKDRFGFDVPGRRPGWALVVDPGVVWSTFLGGSDDERTTALALDPQGVVTIAGRTASTNFPTQNAYDTTHNSTYKGIYDAFVTRLDPSKTGTAQLLFSTFLGGTNDDSVGAIALDANGVVTIGGWTASSNFPTKNAYDTTHNGGGDAFVVRLDPSKTGTAQLLFSTLLGGIASEGVSGLGLDARGATTVVGGTFSPNFPTKNAYDTTYNRNYGDGFVTRLSPSGSSLEYSTFLGGTLYDIITCVAVDPQGVATIAGSSRSADFPYTTGVYDTTHNGRDDAFVARLDPSKTGTAQLLFSTFLGGTNDDGASALALDAQGAVIIAGGTNSTDFPTKNAYDTTYNGSTLDSDAFVARLSPRGSSLVYSTFFGGTGLDRANSLALDASGAATFAGQTWSADLPTTPGAFDRTYSGVNGQSDGFVARLSPSGSNLAYSTYLGGPAFLGPVALDAQGAATVAGWTSISGFPTTNGAYDTTFNGGAGDAFVTRLDMLPTGVRAFGHSSPGCNGPLAVGVNSMPNINNSGFTLTCASAPANATGLLGFAAAGLSTPITLLGARLWLNPQSAFFLVFYVPSDAQGVANIPLPIPNDPLLIGKRVATQFFWAGPTSPSPCPWLGVSASHALEITIQR